MTKRHLVIGILFLVPAVSLFAGETPLVLAPNTTAYSAEQVAVLTQALKMLEETLGDDSLGSRKTFAVNGWTSRDFARYTAGRLDEFGYDVVLASRSDWLDAVFPDASHVWVLVGLALPTRIAWVPVEAAPQPESSQQSLGKIPIRADEDEALWFDERYTTLGKVENLADNQTPVAKFRCSFHLEANRANLFRAVNSHDPDGEIVLYQWDFGDGETATATTNTVRHTFDESGYVTITLTVIDNAGRSGTTNTTRRVISRKECSICGS